VRKLAVNTPVPVMNLFKILAQVTFTSEMMRSSAIEELSRDALTRAIALALDAALFSSAAVSSAAPAGLLNGITSLTPSAATTPTDAMIQDIENLIAALAPIAGSTPVVLISSLQRAMTAPMRTAALSHSGSWAPAPSALP
jgi:hypothetical protein